MEFTEKYGLWAAVAGASEGVGSSLVRQLGARGINVVLVARNAAKLEEVAASAGSETKVLPLDLSTADAATTLTGATADLKAGRVAVG